MVVEKTKAPVVETMTEHMPLPLVDEQADATYYGYAPLGTDEESEGWRIIRVTKVGSITMSLYAQGTMEYRSKWSERENYNYSR